MRIAISTSVVQRGRTGVAQYVFGLLKALLPHTGLHQIYALALEDDLGLFEFAAGTIAIVPVPERYRAPLQDIAWHQVVLPRWLRAHQIDVLHVPSYRRMVCCAPCASVSTIHDLAQFHVANKYDGARMVYGRVIAGHLAKRQTELIAISQSTAHDIQQFFHVPRERIHTVYNGVDSERFRVGDRSLARAEAGKRWGLDRPFLLYVSRIEHPAKNHRRLIEAFNRFKAIRRSDWQLALVGSDWDGAAVVHEIAQASPASADIRFLGFIDDDSLPAIYRAAEAMIYPSLYEGFGLPPVEAMACGCPVLASRRGALGEVVGDAAGTFDPENIDEIVAAMVRVTTDIGWCTQLREAGVLNARRFNWEENAKATLSIYESAVQSHHLSRRLSTNIPSAAVGERAL